MKIQIELRKLKEYLSLSQFSYRRRDKILNKALELAEDMASNYKGRKLYNIGTGDDHLSHKNLYHPFNEIQSLLKKAVTGELVNAITYNKIADCYMKIRDQDIYNQGVQMKEY